MGKQGKTTTNKDNNISNIIALYCCHISPNMACFCELMAQKFSLVRACSAFFLRSRPLVGSQVSINTKFIF